jgi:hypothetical protein
VLDSLNWSWIGVAIAAPAPVALLVAWPLWRGQQTILGNLAATAVLFGSAIAFIFRERIELDRLMQRCQDAGSSCFPAPAPFTRFAIYAFIALVETCAVFYLSLIVEERRRRRGYDPQWR